MLQFLFLREVGEDPPFLIERAETMRRTYSINLAGTKEMYSEHQGPVYSMALESVENRYLLSGSGDAKICCYDLDSVTDPEHKITTYKPIFSIPKGGDGHNFGISSLQWYTFDTGMFYSASYDKTVKVWDTNALEAVCSFEMPERVHCIAVSPAATSHSLIACATHDQKLRLCDPLTNDCSHCLIGHREAIWATKWSPSNEFLLASAGMDQQIKMWDIRMPGPLLNLDFLNTVNTDNQQHRPVKRQKTAATAHEDGITSLEFTPDGLFLLSSGRDNQIRRWNTQDGRNTLVNFPGVQNDLEKGTQMAVSCNSQILYHPNGSVIAAYEISSGKKIATLSGHYEQVNCCVFRPHHHELYSGGNDHQILCWIPASDEPGKEAGLKSMEDDIEDTWSDDDNAN